MRLRSFSQIKAFEERENLKLLGNKFCLERGRGDFHIQKSNLHMNIKLKVAVCQRSFLNQIKKFICTQGRRTNLQPEAGIVKNYCATNSGSPEVDLRFCPWIILFKY